MSAPYLNRGESIILTTHRVSVGSVMYDALLTNERLILMDSRYTSFEPRMILFRSIITVKGGKVPTGDPAIILTLESPSDLTGSEQVNLIFIQQPGETRKHERELWVKELIGKVITAREQAAQKIIVPAKKKTGMQPSIRRWVAPEPVHPHTSVETPPPPPQDAEVISEGPDPLEFFLEERSRKGPEPEVEESPPVPDVPEDLPAPVEPDSLREAEPESPEPVIVMEEEPEELTDIREIMEEDQTIPDYVPDAVSSPYQENTMVELPEEPVQETPAEPEPAPETEVPSSFESTVLAATKSLNTPADMPEIPDTDTTTPEDPREPEEVQPAEPQDRDTGADETRSDTEEKDIPESAEIPEHTDYIQPAVMTRPPSPGQVRELPGTYTPDIPVTGITIGPHNDNTPGNPSGSRKTDHGQSHQILIAGVLVIVALLVVFGGIYLISQYPLGPAGGSQVTVITPTVTQTQPPAPLAEQPKGVRVNVIYPGTFTGIVGNPGSLQKVSGTGNHTFPVLMTDTIVQATIQKQDNSGDTLTVGIYDNSTLLLQKGVTAPMGEVNLLIDVKTASAPGMVAAITPTSDKPLLGNGTLIYY